VIKEKIYNLIDDPFAKFLPEKVGYCTRESINRLHEETCRKLGIIDVYTDILWSYTKNFRDCLAEASYWKDPETKKMQWRIKYCSNSWIGMGEDGRRNTIVHEVCHLAIEKLIGHKARAKKGEKLVLDHGEQWQELMHKCGENPFLKLQWNYR